MKQSHDGQQSFAHFAGNFFGSFNSISSHSNPCYAVQNNYSDSWIADTGASDHMASDLTQLSNLQPLSHPIIITLPDGSLKIVTKFGQIQLFPNTTIYHVLYVLDFKFNLLSVNKLLSNHKQLTLFLFDLCCIRDLSTNKMLAIAPSVDGLYKLSSAGTSKSFENRAHSDYRLGCASFSLNPSPCSVPTLATLHARLRHTSASKMQHMSLL